MEDRYTGTVAFTSNLQPVRATSTINDVDFLKHIRDPFALELLSKKRGYQFTSIQEEEFKRASLHCKYAFPNDYPFGTIRKSDGKEYVICRCTKTDCHLFNDCRPDFDENELDVIKDNLVFRDDAEKVASLFNISKKGDTQAAADIYSLKEDIPFEEGNSAEDIVEIEQVTEVVGEEENTVVNETEVSSFESFVSVEQERVITADVVERTIINAGPGTGKTWTLIEKIKYLLSNEIVEAENILVLCFSKAAVEVVRKRLEEAAKKDELPMEWHMVEVRTFDSFSTYMLAWLEDEDPSQLPDHFMLEAMNYDQRIKEATRVLNNIDDMLSGYEHIIVDEVQDLVGVRAELVLALLSGLPETCGFTLLGDSCQALYDYLAVNDNSVMSSVDFYNAIFQRFPLANYFAFDHNYRHGDTLGDLTIPYRKAILSDSNQIRAQEASKLEKEIKTADVKLQHFSILEVKQYLKKGTLGILTRTNGQALQISAWLRNEGVDHNLNKAMDSMGLGGWINDVILSTESHVLNENEFRNRFSSLYPSADWKKYWGALIGTQRDSGKTWYEIDELIKGLISNTRNPLLYDDPGQEEQLVTVSNIHRAKGREFDTVLVIDDVISGLTDGDNEDELEHKVCYVALTRPRKEVEKVVLPTQYIYISKDESRRCFRAGGFGKRKYLSHFEIGEIYDIETKSFARSYEIQEYLRKSIAPGTRLKLIKCPENEQSFVVYKIVPEEDEKVIIGYTTRRFAFDMERAIQRIYDSNRSISWNYYPRVFGDVYVDAKITCVSAITEILPGARKFGGQYIWSGITVSGFAQIEKDRY